MITAVGSGVWKIISAIESAGELKRTDPSKPRSSKEGTESSNAERGGMVDSKETNTVHGMVTVMGRRRDLTTAASAAVGEIGFYDLFGIFDGPTVGENSGEKLLRLVTEEIEPCGGGGEATVDWGKVVRASFPGTARAVTILGKDEVVVLGCGGSRVVLCSDGSCSTLSLHHGDKSGVEETVMIHKRSDKDEFLVIACSGLWDVVSEKEMCQLVKGCLHGQLRRKHFEGKSPAEDAAAVVTELAMARGSKDNISVIVIDLNKSKFL